MPNNPPAKVDGFVDGDRRKGRILIGVDLGSPDGDREGRVQGHYVNGKFVVDRMLTAVRGGRTPSPMRDEGTSS